MRPSRAACGGDRCRFFRPPRECGSRNASSPRAIRDGCRRASRSRKYRHRPARRFLPARGGESRSGGRPHERCTARRRLPRRRLRGRQPLRRDARIEFRGALRSLRIPPLRPHPRRTEQHPGSEQDADLGTSLFAAARPHRGASQTGLRTRVQAHGMPQTKTHAKSQRTPLRPYPRRTEQHPAADRMPTSARASSRPHAHTAGCRKPGCEQECKRTACHKRRHTQSRSRTPHGKPHRQTANRMSSHAAHAACRKKGSVRRRTLPAHHRRTTDQASLVADSSFFMIEKMNSAERRQSTISTLQTIHSAMPLFQR